MVESMLFGILKIKYLQEEGPKNKPLSGRPVVSALGMGLALSAADPSDNCNFPRVMARERYRSFVEVSLLS